MTEISPASDTETVENARFNAKQKKYNRILLVVGQAEEQGKGGDSTVGERVAGADLDQSDKYDFLDDYRMIEGNQSMPFWHNAVRYLSEPVRREPFRWRGSWFSLLGRYDRWLACADRDRLLMLVFKSISAETFEEGNRIGIAPNRKHLFNLLLRRQDIRSARDLYTDHLLVAFAPFLALTALLIYLSGFALQLSNQTAFYAVSLVYGVWLAWQWLCMGRALEAAAQTLIPRLAGTVIVGFLFIIAGGYVVEHLLANASYRDSVLLLVFTGFFLWLEVCRRVVPAPHAVRIFERIVTLLSIGLCHSIAITLLGLGIIEGAHQNETDSTSGGLHREGLFMVSCTTLTVGVVLNQIWTAESASTPL